MGVMRFVGIGRSLATGLVIGVTGSKAKRRRPLAMAPFAAAIAALPAERDRVIGELVASATMAELRARMDAGELTSEELTVHLLARIARLDTSLCSIIELNPSALDEARAADARRQGGAALGPLDGIPLTLKDNIETAAPMRTTVGAMALADHVAAADAPVVVKLRQAGAVILGKANLSELAGAVCRTPGVSAVGGPTRNPYGERFSPGGSSSGSAVSVAAGLCVASVGTETSGSLLAPATFNGVVGMKPSAGVVPGEGVVPLARRQDSAGPLARSVADAAALLGAIATGDLDVALSPDALRGVTVGVLRADILAQKTPLEDTADNPTILARITDGLTAAGATLSDVAIAEPAAVKAFEGSFTKVVLGGLAHDTVGYLAAAGTPIRSLADLHRYNLQQPHARMPQGQFFVDMALAFDVSKETYEAASAGAVTEAARILAATFAASGAALLVSVSNLHSALYATAGFPAISVPVGLRASGMPAGVTLIGPAGSDAQLLAYAHAFEQATKLRVPPPSA